MLSPLHEALEKNVKFVWNEQCQQVFDLHLVLVKTILTKKPILNIYDRNKKCILQADAPIRGVGAVLKQVWTDGKLHPVGYFSKKLTECQTRYPVAHLEV